VRSRTTVTSSDDMIDDALPTGRDPNALATRRLVALVARSRALTGVISADGTPLYLALGRRRPYESQSGARSSR
jgi:hypothetical protein